MVVFKVVMQPDDVLVPELVHDLDFSPDTLQQVTFGDGDLLHQFDGVLLLGYLVPHRPNGSEGTFPDHSFAQRFEIIRRMLPLLS